MVSFAIFFSKFTNVSFALSNAALAGRTSLASRVVTADTSLLASAAALLVVVITPSRSLSASFVLSLTSSCVNLLPSLTTGIPAFMASSNASLLSEDVVRVLSTLALAASIFASCAFMPSRSFFSKITFDLSISDIF